MWSISTWILQRLLELNNMLNKIIICLSPSQKYIALPVLLNFMVPPFIPLPKNKNMKISPHVIMFLLKYFWKIIPSIPLDLGYLNWGLSHLINYFFRFLTNFSDFRFILPFLTSPFSVNNLQNQRIFSFF